MAKPNLALIPATIGDKVYSILPSDGVGDFDFTRGTKATRINAQGLIEEVASGENRLNYSLLDGEVVGCPHLLLEPSRTNLIQYSEDLSQWSLTNGTLSANSVISPDGTLNADKVVFNNVALDLKRTVTVTANTTYTYSFYIKLESGTGLQGRFYDNSNSANIEYYDYSNQVLGTDWTRVTRQVTTPSGCTQMQVWLLASSSSLVTASFWGAMLEVGSFPTSYIKTTSAAVTRAAETCDGSGNAATFNNSEGVFMAEISSLTNNNPLFNSLSIASGTTNVLSIGFSDSLNEIYVFKTNGSSSWFKEVLVNDITNFNKIALSYESNDNQFWFNGFKIETNNSIGIHPSAMSDMDFNAAVGNEFMYSNTKQIQYFDSILDSEQLEQLTSWDSFRAMAEGQLYTIE